MGDRRNTLRTAFVLYGFILKNWRVFVCFCHCLGGLGFHPIEPYNSYTWREIRSSGGVYGVSIKSRIHTRTKNEVMIQILAKVWRIFNTNHRNIKVCVWSMMDTMLQHTVYIVTECCFSQKTWYLVYLSWRFHFCCGNFFSFYYEHLFFTTIICWHTRLRV